MTYLWAFVVGGLICVAGQLLIDLTSITPARVLVTYVVAGVVLSALGLYDPLAEFAGAGGREAPRGVWARRAPGGGGARVVWAPGGGGFGGFPGAIQFWAVSKSLRQSLWRP